MQEAKRAVATAYGCIPTAIKGALLLGRVEIPPNPNRWGWQQHPRIPRQVLGVGLHQIYAPNASRHEIPIMHASTLEKLTL